jgi:outer membrane protein OmpA-like peptidoglycan-associated protein
VREFKFILYFIFLVTINAGLLGQTYEKPEIRGLSGKALKKFGKQADRRGDIYTALQLYELYYKQHAKDVEVGYRMAELYFQSRDYQKAEKQFSKIFRAAPDLYPEAQYYQAVSLKNQGNYLDAKEAYLKFARKIKNAKNLALSPQALKDEIMSCDLAMTLQNKPQKATINRLSGTINGPHQEMSPLALSNSTLLYASLKPEDRLYFNYDDTVPPPVRQFYTAQQAGMDWSGGYEFDTIVNVKGVETCNGAISRDGNRLYFTRCSHNAVGRYRCEIFVSERVGKSWSAPVKLNAAINDPNYTATQPSIGYTSKSDLEILYFVSDRPGGKGGYDIWYSIYDKNKKDFAEPRNAGGTINTIGNEMTPFYDIKTRSLYFSSNVHQGMGGLDIFCAQGELRKWLQPVNVGYPINSSYDDLYFTINPNRSEGFLTSNRPGGESFQNPTCCDDIYQYRWTQSIKLAVTGQVYPADADKYGPDLDQAKLIALKDKITPLNKAIVVLYMVDPKTKEEVFIDRDTTGSDGVYYFELQPEKQYKFDMEGFQYFNEIINFSTEGVDMTYTIDMPPVWVNVLSDKPIVMKNVYYETNKSELTQRSKEVIDSTIVILMNKARDIVIEIGAHSDSTGSYEYNKKLSQERADNVVKYLITKGINPDRLVAKGYGPDKPVAPNFNADGTPNEKGQEQNRRSEFRVIGTMSSRTDLIDKEINTNTNE